MVSVVKGLESDIILLTDMYLDDDEIQNKIYVEASRAKHRFYVYERV